jgi:hypothetical protein
MDPITIALAVGLPTVGALLGELFSSGDREKAERLRTQIARMFGPDAMKSLEVEAVKQGVTEFDKVKPDEQSVAAQRLALQRLQEDASTVGLTAEERAELEAAKADSAQYEQGQRGAIMQNAQARGVGGSGMELAQMLQSQQGSAMRNNQAATDAAAMASKRRALVNLQMGQFAGQMRGQGWEEQAARARAQDGINSFNTDVANSTNRYNTDTRKWGMDRQAGVLSGQADAFDGNARDTKQTWAGIGQAGGQAAGSYLDYKNRKKG